MVAGGSIRAIEAILRGDVEHAFHPGGGLHHAMPDRASGFCIYDDPALAIARARRDGLRVLYVDLDVHHGDGVQAIHWDDPGVLTLSFHETGRYLFPGTGDVDELGEGSAAGTVGQRAAPAGDRRGRLAGGGPVAAPRAGRRVRAGPRSSRQHGADSHAWDPLAHLRVTTTAMGEAARLVDAVAHRYAGGRWLATGGGGYDAYRVVPRSWSLVWLAGAHREVPDATPAAWRERWAAEAARYGQAPLPERVRRPAQRRDAARRVADGRRDAFDRDRGARPPARRARACSARRGIAAGGIRLPRRQGRSTRRGGRRHRRRRRRSSRRSTPRTWAGLTLAPGVIAPADAIRRASLVAAGLRDGLRATVAVAGTTVVGAALVAPSRRIGRRASCSRSASHPPGAGAGSRGELLAAHVATRRPGRDA